MKQGKKLLILPAVAVLLGMGTGCSGNSENKVQDMAKKALMASVDNPESVKIVGIRRNEKTSGRFFFVPEGFEKTKAKNGRAVPGVWICAAMETFRTFFRTCRRMM